MNIFKICMRRLAVIISISKKCKLLLVSECDNHLRVTLMLIRISLASLNTVAAFFISHCIVECLPKSKLFSTSAVVNDIISQKIENGHICWFFLNQSEKTTLFTYSARYLLVMHFKPRGETIYLCIVN